MCIIVCNKNSKNNNLTQLVYVPHHCVIWAVKCSTYTLQYIVDQGKEVLCLLYHAGSIMSSLFIPKQIKFNCLQFSHLVYMSRARVKLYQPKHSFFCLSVQ